MTGSIGFDNAGKLIRPGYRLEATSYGGIGKVRLPISPACLWSRLPLKTLTAFRSVGELQTWPARRPPHDGPSAHSPWPCIQLWQATSEAEATLTSIVGSTLILSPLRGARTTARWPFSLALSPLRG